MTRPTPGSTSTPSIRKPVGPDKGYEVQINNTYPGVGDYRELKKTGSLYGVRNIYKSGVADGQWFRLRVRVVANRIRVWVNDFPTVDYVQPENPPRNAGTCRETVVAWNHRTAGARSRQ